MERFVGKPLRPSSSTRPAVCCFSSATTFQEFFTPAWWDFLAVIAKGNETFLECVVREVNEEIGYFVSTEQFEYLTEERGVIPDIEGGTSYGQIFVARGIPSQT